MVSVRGIIAGTQSIEFMPNLKSEKVLRPTTNIDLMVDSGVVRHLHVSMNPGNNLSIKVERLVSKEEFVKSVNIACKLGEIYPGGVCKSLSAKAIATAMALENGKAGAARGSLNAFLNELKAQGDKHVKEPALTILREEAEALLKDIEKPAGKKKGGKKVGK